MNTEIIEIVVVSRGSSSSWIWYRMDKGAIFCQVSRMRPELSGTPWVTSGSHVWKGARPSLITNAMNIMVRVSLFVCGCIFHDPS